MQYDLLIVGGGPAGYLAAERAGHAGMSVLLIEQNRLGGVCLNEGCVPTKTLLYSAKLKDSAEHGAVYGVKAENITFTHAKVMARKAKVVRTLVAGIKAQMKRNQVTVVSGTATILPKQDDALYVQVGEDIYTGKNLLIATGSKPILPPITGLQAALEAGFALTNKEILMLDDIPERLVIVGGGVIGLEMAAYFKAAGSEVHVIEMLPKIAGNTDADITALLHKAYVKKGVQFHLNAKVTEIGQDSVIYEVDGERQQITADHVLLSIGRRPDFTGLGLENLDIAVERGFITIDAQGRTNQPHVYAAGDCTGGILLAHKAYREAEVCVATILGKEDSLSYAAVPSVIYTQPEVASVGETETSAQQKGMDVAVSNVSMRYSGRYLAENEGGDGICKVLVNRADQTIVGVQMIGSYASEIIMQAGIMVSQKMTVEAVKQMIFPHPSVCEIIREAVFALELE